jgi:hypothetical protein
MAGRVDDMVEVDGENNNNNNNNRVTTTSRAKPKRSGILGVYDKISWWVFNNAWGMLLNTIIVLNQSVSIREKETTST